MTTIMADQAYFSIQMINVKNISYSQSPNNSVITEENVVLHHKNAVIHLLVMQSSNGNEETQKTYVTFNNKRLALFRQNKIEDVQCIVVNENLEMSWFQNQKLTQSSEEKMANLMDMTLYLASYDQKTNHTIILEWESFVNITNIRMLMLAFTHHDRDRQHCFFADQRHSLPMGFSPCRWKDNVEQCMIMTNNATNSLSNMALLNSKVRTKKELEPLLECLSYPTGAYQCENIWTAKIKKNMFTGEYKREQSTKQAMQGNIVDVVVDLMTEELNNNIHSDDLITFAKGSGKELVKEPTLNEILDATRNNELFQATYKSIKTLDSEYTKRFVEYDVE